MTTNPQAGNRRRNPLWWIIPALLVILAIVFVPWGSVGAWFSDDEKAGDPPPAGKPLSPAQTSGLAVTMVALENACKGQDADGNVPLDIQVINHAAELKFGDSYGVSIQGLAPVDGVNKHLEWNCKDPFQTVADAYGWAHFPIGDGKTVADIPGNEWLVPFKGDPATVVDSKLFPNTKLTAAQSYAYDNFLPTWTATGSLTEEQKQSYHAANVAFQELAGKINTLTKRLLIDPNIQSPTSVWSLHVPNHGLGIVPSLEVAKPEHLEAIVLTVKPDKGETPPCDTARIGFNVNDQRFEIFGGNCEQKAPAPSAAPPAPGTPVGSTSQAPPPPPPPPGIIPPPVTTDNPPPPPPTTDNPPPPVIIHDCATDGINPETGLACKTAVHVDPPPNAPPAVVDMPVQTAPSVPQATMPEKPVTVIHSSEGPTGATAPGATTAPVAGADPANAPSDATISPHRDDTSSGGSGTGTGGTHIALPNE